MRKFGDEIFKAQDVTDEEWQAYIDVQVKAEEDRQKQQWQNWQDDVGDFYAGGIMAIYRRKAEMAKSRGIDTENGLATLDGEIVDAKIVDGKFGRVWRIKHDDDSVEWVNISVAEDIKRQQAHYAKKGYQKVWIKYHYLYGQYGFYADKSRGVLDWGVCEKPAWEN
jgi:hypothetical protein